MTSKRRLITIVTLFALATLTACGGGGGGGAASAAAPDTPPTTPHANNVPRFAYVANNTDNTVSIYTVNPATGQLRHNGCALTGIGPQSVTVDPSGKFAYVANNGAASISGYTSMQAPGP